MADETAIAVLNTGVPAAAQRRGIDESQWNTLAQSLYPGARPDSVILVIDYCRARRLDPLKKPCHIVPIEVKDTRTSRYEWRDVVMPGIYEQRTTAQRTGEYLGRSAAAWGPEIDYKGIKAFEYCDLTIYRYHAKAPNCRIEFPIRVYFREVVNLDRDGKPNRRWTKAPIQMHLKCTEAAGLREAFPDEIGGEQTAEEMHGARIGDGDDAAILDVAPLPPAPDGYEAWRDDLASAADEGRDRLRAAWRDSRADLRDYLTRSDPSTITAWRTRAADADQRLTPDADATEAPPEAQP
jgi:phage recombination protein Bet